MHLATGWRPRGHGAAATLVLLLLVVGGLSAGPAPDHPAAPSFRVPAAAPAANAPPSLPAATPAVRPAAAPSAWTDETPSLTLQPSTREGAAMVYDAADHYLLLFGGLAGTGGDLRDTWTYANGTWTNLTAKLAASPPARYKAGIAYDAKDGYVVLYGGLHSGTYLDDTWTFRAGVWTQVFPAQDPGYREDLGMTYDAHDGYVVLFGGDNQTGVDRNDTWRYSAGVWTNITDLSPSSPPAEETAPLTYDPNLGGVLFFGGLGPRGAMNQTWLFSDGRWSNLTASAGHAPSPREAPMLAYDAADGFDLLFGGLRYPNADGDSWIFENGRWSELTESPSPPARFDGTMAFTDGPGPGFASVVLFGGRTSSNGNQSDLDDTWTFKIPLTAELSVTPGAIDFGMAAQVSVAVAGGFAPYNVTWPELPSGCAGVVVPGNFSCAPDVAGDETLEARVTDAVNDTTATASVVLVVNPLPQLTLVGAPTVGPAPLAVNFTVALTGGTAPFLYAWSFGDQGSSAAPGNLSHTYETAGRYVATLAVTDAVGAVARSSGVQVDVTSALVANLTASAYTGVAPFTVAFQANATGGLAPYVYNWSDDNRPADASRAPNPSFTFTSAGVYRVVLVVTDALGATSSSETNLTILAPLTAGFVASFPQGALCSDGVPVAELVLSASPGGGVPPYTERWSVNGATLQGANASVALPGGLSTSVTLNVTDASGRSVESSQGVAAPTVSCSVSTSSPPPSVFNFLWIFAAALAVVVILEIIVLLSGRRKSP